MKNDLNEAVSAFVGVMQDGTKPAIEVLKAAFPILKCIPSLVRELRILRELAITARRVAEGEVTPDALGVVLADVPNYTDADL